MFTIDASDGRSTWHDAARRLSAGAAPENACRDAGLAPAAIERVGARWGGAWLDLVDGIDGASVLLLQWSPTRVLTSLAERAGVLGVPETSDGRSDFAQAWTAGSGASVVVAPEEELVSREGGWDLVLVDGAVPGSGLSAARARIGDRLAPLAAAVSEVGRLVAVVDNVFSPLRAVDLPARRRGGPAVTSLGGLTRSLQRAGLTVSQRFALLRSSAEPVIAFDLDAPVSARAVLRASLVRTGGPRAVALRLAAQTVPSRLARLVPAWLVVAPRSSDLPDPAPDRPTGRIGYADSEESKVLRGEPPTAVEKRYMSEISAENEQNALRILEAAGAPYVPRPLGGGVNESQRQSWVPGNPLRPGRLDQADRMRWVAQAARVLGELHELTAQAGGEVLVHGDYWLGNLMVEGDSVVGVVDWTESHWGQPDEDLEHLISTAVDELGQAGRGAGSALSDVARREYAAARQRR